MVPNTKLTNTEPLPLGSYRARFPWVSGHNTATNRSTRNLVLCVFLIRGTLFNMYWWFITIKLTANSIVSQALTKLIKYTYFLRKAQSLLALRNTRQHISTMPRGRFKQQNHRQKAWHNTAPTGHLCVVWELNKEAAGRLVWPRLGTWTSSIPIFHCSTQIREWARKCRQCCLWDYK